MESLNEKIEAHYFKAGLFEAILEGLKEVGVNLESVKRSDLSPVDEFHVRGAAVSRELASSIEMKGLKVLDVGCGVGGPSRMLADEFDCLVTGVDLSHEYIRTAKELTRLVKLESKVQFLWGNATELPFKDADFDVAWTQHAQMNIPDKESLYSEIFRVLKPGGYFLYYDIFKGNEEQVNYPVPWADVAEESYLITPSQMREILLKVGFHKVQSSDQTQAGIEFFDALMARMKEFGPPKLGLNVVMGESAKSKLMNLLSQMKTGVFRLESGVYQKK